MKNYADMTRAELEVERLRLLGEIQVLGETALARMAQQMKEDLTVVERGPWWRFWR